MKCRVPIADWRITHALSGALWIAAANNFAAWWLDYHSAWHLTSLIWFGLALIARALRVPS